MKTMTESELRLQLRGLRRDLEPATDLWPGIQARIDRLPAQATASPARGKHATRFAPWALAASLVLAVGVAWRMQPPSAPAATTGIDIVGAVSIDREAAAMTAEYRAALQELQASTPRRSVARPEQPALRELDLSALQIRDALAMDPQSRFLLERLRRTYSLRLELTQRAITQRASIS